MRRGAGRMVGVEEHRKTERKSPSHGQQPSHLLIPLTYTTYGSTCSCAHARTQTRTHARTHTHMTLLLLPPLQVSLICLPKKSLSYLFAFLHFLIQICFNCFLSPKLSISSFFLLNFFGSRKTQDVQRNHCNVI